jgi:hypothetical protein
MQQNAVEWRNTRQLRRGGLDRTDIVQFLDVRVKGQHTGVSAHRSLSSSYCQFSARVPATVVARDASHHTSTAQQGFEPTIATHREN